MNRRVAKRACLILLRLIMECGTERRDAGSGQGVTLEAELVHLGPVEQMRIRRAVRRVTGQAALDLHRRMLVLERPGFIGVAVQTDGLLGGGGAQLVGLETAVRIVAIAALDQAFVHPMMGRLGKVRFDFAVATVAKQGLRGRQQIARHVGRVLGVATGAPNIILEMFRTQEVAAGFVPLMATEAARARFLGGKLLKTDDLRDVSSGSNVRLARSMATLASLRLWTRMRRLGGLPVCAAFEAVAFRLVTGFAGVGADKLRSIGCGGSERRQRLGRAAGWRPLPSAALAFGPSCRRLEDTRPSPEPPGGVWFASSLSLRTGELRAGTANAAACAAPSPQVPADRRRIHDGLLHFRPRVCDQDHNPVCFSSREMSEGTIRAQPHCNQGIATAEFRRVGAVSAPEPLVLGPPSNAIQPQPNGLQGRKLSNIEHIPGTLLSESAP